MAVTIYNRATGNLQNLKSGDCSQGFWNLTRKAVVIKTAVLARRHPKKNVTIVPINKLMFREIMASTKIRQLILLGTKNINVQCHMYNTSVTRTTE
jgi:hypothetical protein